MSGHIQQKGRNWYCVIERGYGDDGKRLTPLWYSVRKELGLLKPATKTQARELLVKLLAGKQQGQIIKPKQIKFEDFARQWYGQYSALKNLADNTRIQYSNIIHNHLEVIDNIDLPKITSSTIQELLADKRQDFSASTVGAIYKVLNLAFKSAIKQEYIIKNPMENVTKPATPRPKIDFWDEEEATKFIRGAKDYPTYYPIYRLALATGMRKAEIINLKCGQVDYDNCTVTILDAKTDSGWRTIDVSPLVIATLPRRDKEEYMFVSTRGNTMHRSYLNTMVGRIAETAGIKKITFHGLRHTFATLMLARGTNPVDLAYILGHSDPSQLWKTYAHRIPSKRKEAARLLDDLLE